MSEKDEAVKDEALKDVSTAKKQQAATQEFFEEKAEEAKAGEEPRIDLTSKVKVEFTEDVGFMKKGMKQEISQAAFDIYNHKKVIVKKIK